MQDDDKILRISVYAGKFINQCILSVEAVPTTISLDLIMDIYYIVFSLELVTIFIRTYLYVLCELRIRSMGIFKNAFVFSFSLYRQAMVEFK